jgi:hypothetical protein
VSSGDSGTQNDVEPLPEIKTAFAQLAACLDATHDLPGQLQAIATVASGLVPSAVGVSLSVILDGESYTVTATAPEALIADAGQYLDEAGPCLEAVATSAPVTVNDILDEDRWELFRHAGAAVGIRSSLSLALRDDGGHITGGLNVYAAERGAFDGLEEVFASVFGAPTSEVVKNADLSFMTRDWARQLPAKLETRRTVETAVGVLRASRGWTEDQARERLRDAAHRAGVELERVAGVVLHLAS